MWVKVALQTGILRTEKKAKMISHSLSFPLLMSLVDEEENSRLKDDSERRREWRRNAWKTRGDGSNSSSFDRFLSFASTSSRTVIRSAPALPVSPSLPPLSLSDAGVRTSGGRVSKKGEKENQYPSNTKCSCNVFCCTFRHFLFSSFLHTREPKTAKVVEVSRKFPLGVKKVFCCQSTWSSWEGFIYTISHLLLLLS